MRLKDLFYCSLCHKGNKLRDGIHFNYPEYDGDTCEHQCGDNAMKIYDTDAIEAHQESIEIPEENCTLHFIFILYKDKPDKEPTVIQHEALTPEGKCKVIDSTEANLENLNGKEFDSVNDIVLYTLL